jgi:streptogramin lyase
MAKTFCMRHLRASSRAVCGRRRRAFRPGVERIESRVVLSGFALFVSSFSGSGGLGGSGTTSLLKVDTAGNESTFAAIGTNTPNGMALDQAGDLYVAYEKGTVEKFSPSGADKGAFASGLKTPTGLAFDQSGDLYVAESGTSGVVIEKYSPSGSDMGVFAQLPSALSANLAFDAAGNLYASSFLGIERFSPSGTDLGTFASGSYGGMAFDQSGNLFASDQVHLLVEKYGPGGNNIGPFVSNLGAAGLAFDSSGDLYVLNYALLGSSIEEYSPSGAHLKTLASGFDSSEYMAAPISTTPAATQLVVTAQPPSSVTAGLAFGLTVTAEDASGHVATSFGGTVTLALANNPGGGMLNGTLMVTAMGGVATFTGLSINQAGANYTLSATSSGLAGATTGAIDVVAGVTEFPTPSPGSNPISIVAGPDGNLWFTEGGTGNLGMINPTTHAAAEFPLFGSFSQDMVAGPDGLLWFTKDFGGVVGTIDPRTDSITQYPVPTNAPDSDLVGIVAGPDGNLWIADDSDGQIDSINPITHAAAAYPLPSSSASPEFLTVGPDGNLWFTDFGTNSIGMFNVVSHTATEFALPTAGAGPASVAAGPDGRIWFTEFQSGKIGRIDPATHAVTEYPLPSSFDEPEGIAAGPDGRIWFCEQDGQKVAAIDPNSGAITEYSGPGEDFFLDQITVGPDGNMWFTDSTGAVGTIPTAPGADSELVVTAQPPSSVATLAPFSVTVKAEDSKENVNTSFSGPITVTLADNPAGDSLGGTITATAVHGVATISGLTLHKAGAGVALEIAGGGLAPVRTGAINVTAGQATGLSVTVPPPASVVAGASFGLSVSAVDASGMVATSFNGVITLALATDVGGATLGGVLSVSAVNGVATFSGLTLDKVGSGDTLSVSAIGLAKATTSAIAVAPGAAAQLAVATQPPASVTAGARFGLIISVRDALGNLATSFSGTITAALAHSDGGANLGGTLMIKAVDGVATFSDLTLDKVGIGDTLSCSGANLASTTTSAIAVVPGAATQVVVTTEPPGTVAAGAPFGLSVAAEDAWGNVAGAFGGTFEVAFSSGTDGTTLGGTRSARADQGVASFSGLTLDKAAGGDTLRVSGSGLAGGTTAAIVVVPGMATQLVVTSAPPARVSAGEGFGLAVSAEDAWGNPVPFFSGNVTVSLVNGGAGEVLGGVLSATTVGGVASFQGLTLDRSGGGMMLAVSANGLSGATSTPILVTAGPAAQLVLTSAPPANVSTGDLFGLTVTAVDAEGNLATSFDEQVTVSGAGGALGGPVLMKAAGGVATFSGLMLEQPGSYLLQVSGSGVALAQGIGITAEQATHPGGTGTVAGPPPAVIGALATTSRRGVTLVIVTFDRALDPSSASNETLFVVDGAVTKRRKTTYSRPVRVASARYVPGTQGVILQLAKTYRGRVQVTVRAGMTGADGVAAPRDVSVRAL